MTNVDTTNPAWSLVMMAKYNTAANAALYSVCEQLSDEDLRAERKAFFGSIFATLNHIMVGDQVWLQRLRDGLTPGLSLTDTLYENLSDLRAARVALDAEIEAFTVALTPERLAKPWGYFDTAGNERHDPYAICVTQLFNHQTHHRGQIHCMLTQAGVDDPPVFDVHRVIGS